jgi:hypothetical protein
VPPDQPPESGDGLSPTHPIVLPIDPEYGVDVGDQSKVLVFVWIPGYGGMWFLVDTSVPVHPPSGEAQPKK